MPVPGANSPELLSDEGAAGRTGSPTWRPAPPSCRAGAYTRVVRRTPSVLTLWTLIACIAGCGDASGRQPEAAAGSAAHARTGPSAPATPQPIETTYDKMKAFEADVAAGSGSSAAPEDEYVPAEFKSGAARWKDSGVYVDGRPVGFLTWGELPIALTPVWVNDKVSAEKRPGTNDPGWRWSKQRFYRFDQYLRAIGVDLRRVKELHVYGPKLSEVHVSSGKELRGPLARRFMFRFGGNTGGKPIPSVPGGFGSPFVGDKISGVMVYIDKTPPTIVRNEGPMLDGVLQTGVPYFGEPLRGGVRVYKDDKLVAIIKRQELPASTATKRDDGQLTWRLSDVLRAQGVTLDGVAQMWVVRNDRRTAAVAGSELAEMTFAASSQAKGGIELGTQRIKANALTLHSRNLRPEDIPAPTADDE